MHVYMWFRWGTFIREGGEDEPLGELGRGVEDGGELGEVQGNDINLHVSSEFFGMFVLPLKFRSFSDFGVEPGEEGGPR